MGLSEVSYRTRRCSTVQNSSPWDEKKTHTKHNSGTKGYLSDETSGTVEIFIESKKLLQNNIKADEDDNVDENED
ncbi:unnamed protein product [Rotaria sordida]|uniref:Uncharacterized protein n=1 Tax=Rotaria sordida TaxID=392033 RepID=A0A813U915_9BILA|nr:unnamed protein product [Rotaria sordida]